MIYIFDGVNFANLSDEDYKKYQNKKFSIFIYTSDDRYFSKNLFDGGVFIDGAKENLVNDILEADADTDDLSLNQPLSTTFRNFIDDIRDDMLIFGPGLLTLILLVLSFSKLYFVSKKRQNAIYESLGYRAILINKNYIIELMVAVIVSLICSSLIFKFIPIYSWVLTLSIILIAILVMASKTYKIQIKDIKEYK